MKILFIAPRYTGGVGGHASRVAKKLRENGLDVKLMDAPKIPIKNLKNPSFAVLSTLKAILTKEKFDVVHAFNVPSAFAMRYVKAKKNLSVFLSLSLCLSLSFCVCPCVCLSVCDFLSQYGYLSLSV